jgi:hypothetical protein
MLCRPSQYSHKRMTGLHRFPPDGRGVSYSRPFAPLTSSVNYPAFNICAASDRVCRSLGIRTHLG